MRWVKFNCDGFVKDIHYEGLGFILRNDTNESLFIAASVLKRFMGASILKRRMSSIMKWLLLRMVCISPTKELR